MKKKILNIMMMAIVAVAAISCYDEQEGNDFDTRLPDVEIVIPNTTYSGSLGQVITIEPQVKTEIPENDLDYFWEVSGNRSNDFGREFYTPLVSDDEQGKTLTFHHYHSRHHWLDGTVFRGSGQRRWSAYGRRVHAKGKFAA